MRVNPYFVTNLSSALDQTQATEQQLSTEISSGLGVTSIGQNPVAAAQNAQLLNQIGIDVSFTQSSNLALGMLNVTDSALGSVVTQLNQAISLGAQGSNGTLSTSQMQAISNQLAGIRDEVLSLANTSYQGQYVFGGSQTGGPPFTLNTGTTPASVTYNGDSVVNQIQPPTGQPIALNIPGNQIFTDSSSNVLGALNTVIADFAAGNAAAGAADTAALNSALSFVSQQRVTLDNSINRLNTASALATSEQTQLTNVQTNLIQADIPAVSTQLSLLKSQQTALINVIAALGSGSLFDKL